MDKIKLEYYHGGEFITREGIYYYAGGTIETIYDVDFKSLTIESFRNFATQNLGYGDGLKFYYKTHDKANNDRYKILWNDETNNELIEDARRVGYVDVFVDHCGENKAVSVVVGYDMNTEAEGMYEDESNGGSDIEGDEEYNTESDVPLSEGDDDDDELTEIMERKRMIKDGKIDLLKQGKLIDMVINNGVHDVNPGNGDEEERREGVIELESHDMSVGETPTIMDLTDYEIEPLQRQIQFEDNTELGFDKIGKSCEENNDADSDSFIIPSPVSTDSGENEEEVMKDAKKKKNKQAHYPEFNPNTTIELIDFEPGMLFTSREQLKEAIRNYGVAKQRRVYLKKNDFERVQAKCREGCKWELWASRVKGDVSFQVRTYKREHNCIIVSKQRMVKADWLAEKFGSIIRSNPRWKLKDFVEAINAKYKIHCTTNQCWWAKKIAMAELESVLAEHYGRLWDYGAEILKTNAGSSVFIKGETNDASEQPIFQRFYVCFKALRTGFLEGCRNVIGLDGCFLKGYVKGELLTAIGRDGNNQMFPIAWAVVEVECTDSWVWFLKLLKDDLNLNDGYNLTLVTDQQKGLKNAIEEHLPAAEHRCCARHIYANWRKNHPGHALKCAFWKAAKSSTIAEFTTNMDEIRSISPFAYNDLLKTNPKYWSRAYFNTSTHCEVVDNNLSESFNSWILEARYKPIISMLDHIRVQCMERIHIKRDYMAKMDTDLCPRIIRKLNFSIEASKLCTSVWDGGEKFEVKDKNGNQYEVDMKNRYCSCRRWQLTGIPCSHGCQAIMSIGGEPEKYVDACFNKSTYMKAYSHLLSPMKGSKDWPVTTQTKLLPPKARRMPGRPKKHRRREAGEEGSGSTMSKRGIAMKCSRCLIIGHNRATCKTEEYVVKENHMKAAEAKRAESEAAKAHSLRKKANIRKKTNVGQRKSSTNNTQSRQGTLAQENSIQSLQKKRRGRPPKNVNVQVNKKPAGVGVLVADDGNTYLSTAKSITRLTSSQPTSRSHHEDEALVGGSASQPVPSSLFRKGKKQAPRSELQRTPTDSI